MIGSSKSVWGFDPRTIPGCQLWLDGADQSSMTLSGSSITVWNDKSGNGKHAIATGTLTYLSGGGVNFNGSSYFLNQTFSQNLSQRSIFIVFNETSHTDYAGVFPLIPTPNSGFDQLSETGLSVELATNNDGYTIAVVGDYARYQSRLGYGAFLQKAIYYDSMNETTGSGYFNGVNVTNVTATYTAGTCSGYGVGGRWQGGIMDASYRLNGVVHEILFYNRPLTNSERQQVEGYLAQKWGLQTSIPSTHPFYSVRPHLRAFQPTDVPGCQLWLDGADSSSLVLSGSNVTQWNDKSGNGFNGTVVNASVGSPIAPSYVTNSINGLPAITMSGTSYFQGTTNVNGTVCTSFFVGSCTFGTGGSSQQRLLAIGELELDDYSVAARCILLQVYSSGTKACPFRAGVFPTVTIENSSINLYSVIFDGTNASIYLNGNTPVSLASSGSFITNIYAVGSDAGTQFMGGTSSLGTNCLVGKIGEILVYNTALTTSQRQQVEGYLAHKWGLSLSVPSTHSFKSFPPASLPFSPRNISGLALWFDAADSNTITLSSGSLTQWNDKSGNGRNLTAVSGYANATVSSAFQNGLNVFNFSGNGLYRTVANSAVYPQDVYIIVALKSLTNQSDVLSMGPTDADNFNSLIFSEDIQSRWKNGSSFGIRNLFSPINETSTGFLLIQWSIANINYLLRRNGTLLVQSSSFAYSLPGGSIFQVGFRHTDITSANFSGYIGEIVVFNNQLGDAQRQQVEGYLAHKWGMSASLPATHPFKSFPPP